MISGEPNIIRVPTYEATSFVMIFFNEEKVSPLTLLTVVKCLSLEEILDTECEARGGMVFDLCSSCHQALTATQGDRQDTCCINLRSG